MNQVDRELVEEMATRMLFMLRQGDLAIYKEQTVFEPHSDPCPIRANELYQIYYEWAETQVPEAPRDYRAFYRKLFTALGMLNANKLVLIRINRADCGVYVLLNDRTVV